MFELRFSDKESLSELFLHVCVFMCRHVKVVQKFGEKEG